MEVIYSIKCRNVNFALRILDILSEWKCKCKKNSVNFPQRRFFSRTFPIWYQSPNRVFESFFTGKKDISKSCRTSKRLLRFGILFLWEKGHHFISFLNWSIWFKVPIRPVDNTNCNKIWWLELVAYWSFSTNLTNWANLNNMMNSFNRQFVHCKL